MKKQNILWIYGLILLLLAAVTAYFYSFNYLKWNIPLYAAAMVLIVLEGAAAFALLAAAKGKPKKKLLFSALFGGGVAVGGVFLFSFVINILIYQTGGAKQATLATTLFAFVLALVCVWILKKSTEAKFFWKPLLAVVLCVCLLLCGLAPMAAELAALFYDAGVYTQAAPTGLSAYTGKETRLVENADLYIAPDGSDENDGSFSHPLATPEKARDLVRAMDKTGKTEITVALKAGEYRVSSIRFTEEDSGTADCPVTWCACGDGEVILNGGVTLPADRFVPVSDEAKLARLPDGAKDQVLCLDLHALGITAEQYGKIYAIGCYHTADRYDGDYTGDIYSELFINDVRQQLARYPNDGWLETEGVVSEGNHDENARNPESEVYHISASLAERISTWETFDDVWAFGYWTADWADASTPIGSVDFEKHTFSPKFVGMFGVHDEIPFRFFNVFEELDSPGEWYLDRDAGTLYLYPPEELSDAVIDFTLTTEPIILCENVHDLSFTGFTVKGTRGDAVRITGDRCTVSHCLIKNVGGSALSMDGYDNLASENEITHTGKAGITITGGDRTTLKHGNSKADNNLIHDWSEIYYTYQPAVTLGGVGNVCSHNEIYNSPHEAITYGGNDNIVEYNLIHDVCLLSDDAGAIYTGRSWTMYGDVVRYNVIYNIGTPGEHYPQGIYMDDALAGQTIYGNLLVNMPCFGLLLGGGRDLTVQNNVVINTKENGVSYDERAIAGELSGGWFRHCPILWEELENSPWRGEIWQKAYPQTAGLHYNADRTDDPMYAPNAANSRVTGNLFVNFRNELGNIAPNPARFSDISGNAVYKMSAMKKLFVDPEHGDYTLRSDAPVFDKIPGFEQIPLGEIGRY